MSESATREAILKARHLAEYPEVLSVNIGDIEADQVRALLRDSLVGPQSEVLVIWASENESALMRFEDVVNFYDDLWYPSRDDIWILASSPLVLIDIDHEEMLSIRAIKKDPSG